MEKKNSEQKKNKFKWQGLLIAVCIILAGFGFGLFIGNILDSSTEELVVGDFLLPVQEDNV